MRFKRVLESDVASVYEMNMILFTHQSTSSSLTQKSCTLPAPLPCTYASQQKIKSMQCCILSEHSYNANTQPCKDKIVQMSSEFFKIFCWLLLLIVIRKPSRLLLKAEFQSEFQLELLKKSTALCFNDKIPT